MKIRLLLAGATLAIAAAPLATAPAHASYCNPDFEPACTVISTACRTLSKYCKLY